MAFWNRNSDSNGVPSSNSSSGLELDKVDLGVRSGHIDLDKDQVVTLDLDKTDASGYAEFSLIATFRKDYDVAALVEYKDGHTEDVACYGTQARPAFSLRTRDGAVVHFTGDKAAYNTPDGQSMEIIHVTMTPDIRSIAFYVYSAQNSGVGSFYRYRVSTYVVEGHVTAPPTGGNYVSIEAKNANHDEHVYSLVPVVIHNTDIGMPAVEYVELYSRRNSEDRPVIQDGRVRMDAGSRNLYKSAPQG